MKQLGQLAAKERKALDQIDTPAVLLSIRLGIDVCLCKDAQRLAGMRLHPERQLGESDQFRTARRGRIRAGASSVSCFAEPTLENAD